MELDADEPGVIRNLDDFRKHAVRRHAGKAQTGRLEGLLVTDIYFITMAMPLADAGGAVNPGYLALWRKHRLIGAKTHRPAEFSVRFAPLERITAHPLGHQPDDRMVARAEFGRTRSAETRKMTRGLDHRHLHAKANAEIWQATFTREARRSDLAFRTPFAEPPRH